MASTSGPHNLSWTNPTTNVDGSPYDAATDSAGIDIVIDGLPAVSVPVGGVTTFDLSTLAEFPALKSGAHTVAIEIVPKIGVASALSAAATFSVGSAPAVATNLAVA